MSVTLGVNKVISSVTISAYGWGFGYVWGDFLRKLSRNRHVCISEMSYSLQVRWGGGEGGSRMLNHRIIISRTIQNKIFLSLCAFIRNVLFAAGTPRTIWKIMNRRLVRLSKLAFSLLVQLEGGTTTNLMLYPSENMYWHLKRKEMTISLFLSQCNPPVHTLWSWPPPKI